MCGGQGGWGASLGIGLALGSLIQMGQPSLLTLNAGMALFAAAAGFLGWTFPYRAWRWALGITAGAVTADGIKILFDLRHDSSGQRLWPDGSCRRSQRILMPSAVTAPIVMPSAHRHARCGNVQPRKPAAAANSAIHALRVSRDG